VRRADYTQNHCFSDAELVQAYLRILKKSRVLPHYRVEEFREEEGKTKDVREANRHSYKQSCKSAAFFAYDKTAQLAMLGEEGAKLKSGRILRLECTARKACGGDSGKDPGQRVEDGKASGKAGGCDPGVVLGAAPARRELRAVPDGLGEY
jgi:hypothetical protein